MGRPTHGPYFLRVQRFPLHTGRASFVLLLLLMCGSSVSVASFAPQLHPITKTKRPQRDPYQATPPFFPIHQSHTRLYVSPEKEPSETTTTESFILNSIATITAAFALLASAGVFWSEWAVLQTGCGPLGMSDWLERSCYLGVLVVSGMSVFGRIVFQTGLAEAFAASSSSTTTTRRRRSSIAVKTLLQISEMASLLAVAGAIVVLGNQTINGETMDGMSGIDLEKCRALQSFEQQLL